MTETPGTTAAGTGTTTGTQTGTTTQTTTTGTNGAGEPFYKSWSLDADATKFIQDRGFTDPGALIKSHINADRVAGARNVFEKPADIKKLNEWNGWTELGWISEADKYKLTPPKPPEGLKVDQAASGALFETFGKAAHELRVPLPMAQGLQDAMWNHMVEQVKGIQASGARSRQELETSLRGEWGGDFDRNSTIAKRAMAAFNPNPDDTSLIARLTSEPALVKMFHTIGEQIGEAHLPTGGAGGGFGSMSKEAAETELRKLEGDPNWMKVFTDAQHPQNQDYVKQRRRLIQIAAGERVI